MREAAAETPWWHGTGYEVCEPIVSEDGEDTLQATYTPNNGIRLSIENTDDGEDAGSAQFDLDRERALWLAEKLTAWAKHNHGIVA